MLPACRIPTRPGLRLELGVLGRAQRRYPLEIVGYAFLSSHDHLLLRVDQAERLSELMAYFGGNLAREVARLTGWKDKVWSRRYESILITDEEPAQVERLAYILRAPLMVMIRVARSVPESRATPTLAPRSPAAEPAPRS